MPSEWGSNPHRGIHKQADQWGRCEPRWNDWLRRVPGNDDSQKQQEGMMFLLEFFQNTIAKLNRNVNTNKYCIYKINNIDYWIKII